MDFDDLLYMPAPALRTNEELRADLDARFRYVLIDEYQDTNQAQYELARRCRSTTATCVVGDPDQSIYQAGAVRTSKTFSTSNAIFPDARVVASRRRTIAARKRSFMPPDTLIDHNKQRKKKDLDHRQRRRRTSPRLDFQQRPLRSRSDRGPRMKQAVEEKRTAYRDHRHLRAHQCADANARIGVRQARRAVPDRQRASRSSSARKTSDVIAYLRLLVNPHDNLSFLRAVNEPARGIGKVSLEHLLRFSEEHDSA